MTTARTEEYLETIYKLQEEDEKPVSITKVAEHLKLSAASASEMIKRLTLDGQVTYTKKGKISLTAEGLQKASQVIRRHRLAERWLTDDLKLDWDTVHDEACKLEHVISAEVEERLAASLGNPSTCPHGYPIPDRSGAYPKLNLKPLSEMTAGEESTVSRVKEDRSDVLKYLAEMGIKPTVMIKMIEIAPFGGPLTIAVAGSNQVLGQELAALILVDKKD